jgi:NAD(P)-dependent dehydrogenase (short-subunit alcohol dehydrogenase family)
MGILEDKGVLITGAASGIGRATAMAAAQEGARLVLADITAHEGEAVCDEVRAAGGEATFVSCDVTSESDVEAMVAGAASTLGRLDGAFNCAGILGVVAMTTDVALDDWKRILDVDLNGVFLCTKHELTAMAAQGSGAILNMASAAGLIGWAGASGYVAAKHGVVGLTKSAALEYAEDGIRVNCVNPGYITTPMTKETVEERGEQILAKVPMRRMGVPGEIAEAVAWMCSDKASFMTGAAHVIDGGYYAA